MGIVKFNLEQLIRDAFYALPDITGPEGEHLGGVYGALFKINDVLKSGDQVELELAPAEPGALSLLDQGEKLKTVLSSKGIEIPDSGEAAVVTLSEEISPALEEALGILIPGAEGAAPARINVKTIVVDDYTEAGKIFEAAAKSAQGSRSGKASGNSSFDRNYIGYYFLTDNGKDKKARRKVLGLALCYEEDKAYYIPARNFVTDSFLGQKLSELSESCQLSTFDIKESYNIFTPAEIASRTYGYSEGDTFYRQEKRCFDTLIGAYLVNPIKNDYEPWDVSSEYLKLPLPKRLDALGKDSLAEAEDDKLADYAGKIAYVCAQAAAPIRDKLIHLGMEELFYNIEMPLSYILYAMEKEGIIARKEALSEYGDKLSVRITELEKAIYEAAGCEFNINSPKQLGEILFERLGLPAEKKTKSGYSTAADVLEKLAPEHKIVADILEYRGLAKLKSTYADGLAAFIEEDDRIHTSFNQTITATGRISSTEPNLQNIPMRTELGRLIRKVFVPKEGHVFADADYSQIELRILAHMSQDQGLISAYHEGDDIHAITASKVFHVPFDEVTPLMRRNAKAVNFGIVYGISSFGLSQDLSISVGEAKEYMEKYFETYPGVKQYQTSVIDEAKEKGYSVTLFGRRRPIPELKAGNFMMRQFGERVAMNAPIQGTAADIMKIAMINVFFRIRRENLKSRLILQIHDELVIETALDEESAVTGLLKEEMEKAVTLAVPMEVDCHTGSDWYEAK